MALTIGYSSLGLPTQGAWPEVMDVVLGQAGFDLVELHPHQPLAPPLSSAVLPAAWRARIIEQAREVTARNGRVVLGLGARHLLGPAKHEPSLFCEEEAGQRQRVHLLAGGIEIAASIGSEILIFLSGPTRALSRRPPLLKHEDPAWARLCRGLEQLLPVAERCQVVLAVEAHSGHLVSSIADIAWLKRAFDSPWLGFTADTVHQRIMEPGPLRELYRQSAPAIRHLQLDNTSNTLGSDVPIEHLLLDEPGEVDVPEVISGLLAGDYRGCVSVEFLSEDFVGRVDPLAYCRRIGPWLREVVREAQRVSGREG